MFRFNLLENQQRNFVDAGMVRPNRSDLKDPQPTHHTRPVFRPSYLGIFSRMIQAHGSKPGTANFPPDPSASSSARTHSVLVPVPATGAKTPPTHPPPTGSPSGSTSLPARTPALTPHVLAVPPPTGSSSGSASLSARTPALTQRSPPSRPPLARPVGAQVCQLERPALTPHSLPSRPPLARPVGAQVC